MSAFLKLDVFRKLPRDLTEPTFCGAIVSTVCGLALALLTITEIRTYLKPSTSSMITIQGSHEKDKFNINVDIMLAHMPCDVIGFDLEDSMGNHVNDYYGELKKYRIDKTGQQLSFETWQEKTANRRDILDRVIKELDEEQGCRLTGFVEAVRVPGNFHIGTHAFGDIVQSLSIKGYHLDNSFKINHLSFGTKADFEQISQRFPDSGLMHPLDGFERNLPEDQKFMRVGFYLKAVPAIFLGEFGNLVFKLWGTNWLSKNEVFQLTATSETEFQSFESLIIFNYEVSPFAVMYTNAKENIFQFLINMCAIVGGVFTFAGIVDSLIHKGSKIVFKDRINKLQ